MFAPVCTRAGVLIPDCTSTQRPKVTLRRLPPLSLASSILRWVYQFLPSTQGLGRIVGQAAPPALPSPPPQHWDPAQAAPPWLFTGFWGSNPGPHACMASTLSMEPSPSAHSILSWEMNIQQAAGALRGNKFTGNKATSSRTSVCVSAWPTSGSGWALT